MALLNLRKSRRFTPTKSTAGSEYKREFEYAIQSIHSAGLYLRKNRNVFLNEHRQPDIDNPTRWLDAILENMSQRDVMLDIGLANRMLDCYASTGRSGKAIHFFYKVTQKEIVVDDDDVMEDVDDEIDDNHEIVGKGLENDTLLGGTEKLDTNTMNDDDKKEQTSKLRRSKIRMKLNPQAPPFYKMPSDVKLQNEMIKRPRREGLVSKLDWEKVSFKFLFYLCI